MIPKPLYPVLYRGRRTSFEALIYRADWGFALSPLIPAALSRWTRIIHVGIWILLRGIPWTRCLCEDQQKNPSPLTDHTLFLPGVWECCLYGTLPLHPLLIRILRSSAASRLKEYCVVSLLS